MPARSASRYLAPVALVATIAGTYLIAHKSLDSKHAATSRVTLPTSSTATVKGTRRVARIYVVRPGDNLSTISHKTHVPIADLEALNPNIDPNLLRTGQRLRLRR